MSTVDQVRESRLGWPKFFGSYDRRRELEELQREPSRWMRPVSAAKAWATIGSTIIMVVGAVAMRSIDTPPTPIVPRDSSTWSLAARTSATEAQVAALTGRVAALEEGSQETKRDVRLNTYISCELLRRSQPNALPPHECSDDEQRARRTK